MLRYGFIVLLLGLSGCVSLPSELQVSAETITTFHQLQSASPKEVIGKPVRLGGKILKATVFKNYTEIEVLSLPVGNLSGKPIVEARYDGRFLAHLPGFVEPENLKEQFITLVGEITQFEYRPLDNIELTYPTLHVQKYKVWKLASYTYIDPQDWEDYRYERIWGGWSFPPRRIGYRLN